MNPEVVMEMMNSKKKFLVWFMLFLAIHGTASFIMFVSEEAMQTAMFGAFAYSNMDDLEGLEWHLKYIMKPTHKVSSILIALSCAPGFISCPGYLNYIRANSGYIKSMEAKIYYNQEKEK